MHTCDNCKQENTQLFDLTVIKQDNKRKAVKFCERCIDRISSAGIGEWYSIESTDELIRLPDSFFMRL